MFITFLAGVEIWVYHLNTQLRPLALSKDLPLEAEDQPPVLVLAHQELYH